MKSSCTQIIIIAGIAIYLAAPVMAQQPSGSGKVGEASQKREKALRELGSDTKKIVSSLKTLTTEQKSAVVALMTITRAAGAYESRFIKKDDAALRELYEPFRQFSPAYKAPGKLQGLIASCFDATVSCLNALKKCTNKGKKQDDCEQNDPDVVVSCANEAICMTKAFMDLHKEIPSILKGKDPWPPQPFPY